jgi:hypothetical protein
MKYACPCSGYKTLAHEPPGAYNICEICFWKDDIVQFDDPDYEGGANIQSLRQYQKDFLSGRVNLEPTENDERDPNWKPMMMYETHHTEALSKPFIWCLVGNIIEKRFYGESKEIKLGTKKFRPNSKVYCFPALWHDGYESIKVIGRTRNKRSYQIVITSAKYITNWRLKKVYIPFIIQQMTENNGWTNSEESKQDILALLEWLPQRTMKVD